MAKAKAPVYSSREQEVLDKVDYYRIRVFQHGVGWTESAPFDAAETLQRYKRIKELNYHRVCLYAARKFPDGERLACVTPAYLSALLELQNVKQRA